MGRWSDRPPHTPLSLRARIAAPDAFTSGLPCASEAEVLLPRSAACSHTRGSASAPRLRSARGDLFFLVAGRAGRPVLDHARRPDVAAGGLKVRDDERVSPVLQRDGAATRDLELLAGNVLVRRVLR